MTKTDDRPALLPCPFCGGPARVQPNGYPKGSLVPSMWWEGVCDECDFVGPALRSKDEAIKHWNHRAGDAP